MSVRILFVSDPHFSKNITSDPFQERLQADNLNILLDAIKERYRNNLDLIVFLGDYVRGSSSSDDKSKCYEKFINFLSDIEKGAEGIFSNNCNVREHIIIVPGNHDVNRDDIENILKRFKSDFSAYIHPFRTKSGSISKFDSPIFVYDDIKLLVACISTVDMSAVKGKDDKIYDIPSVSPNTIRDFTRINNEELVSNKYSDYNKIVLSHHPMVVAEHGTTVKSFNYTTNGFNFFSSALAFGYKYFIHGHLHDYSCIRIEDKLKPGYIATQIGVPNFDLVSKVFAVEFIIDENKDVGVRYLSINEDKYAFKEDKYIQINEQRYDSSLNSNSEKLSYILIDRDIEQIIAEAKIVKNGDSTRIEAASYDCALGRYYKRQDPNRPFSWQTILFEIKREELSFAEITIHPGETILIYTEEYFDIPDDMVLHASPISSWARKGLRVDLSYFIDPGFKGEFCFPVTNMSKEDIRISSREAIMSVEFINLNQKVKMNWRERHKEKAKIREEHSDK